MGSRLRKLGALLQELFRPSGRWAGLLVWLPLLLAIVLTGDVARAQGGDAFRQFLAGVWPEAQAAGVSRATFDAALRGVEPDLALPDLMLPGKADVKGQAEFTKTPAQYLSAAYLANLSAEGRSLATRHEVWLAKIEKELGVQRQFVLAIWGRETAFGSHRSNYYIIRALATLQPGLRPRRRRPRGHLDFGAGRPGLGCQPAARQGLGPQPELGL